MACGFPSRHSPSSKRARTRRRPCFEPLSSLLQMALNPSLRLRLICAAVVACLGLRWQKQRITLVALLQLA